MYYILTLYTYLQLLLTYFCLKYYLSLINRLLCPVTLYSKRYIFKVYMQHEILCATEFITLYSFICSTFDHVDVFCLHIVL